MRDDHPVFEAIRRSRRRDTASESERWSSDRRATGHDDVSSSVAWEHPGGDLVPSQVFVDREPIDRHRARVDAEPTA